MPILKKKKKVAQEAPAAAVATENPTPTEDVVVVRGKPGKSNKVLKAEKPSTPSEPKKPLLKKKSKTEAATPEAPATTAKPGNAVKRVKNATVMEKAKTAGIFTLATNRVCEQLEALASRATVKKFSGRSERPELVISSMENQALQQVT